MLVRNCSCIPHMSQYSTQQSDRLRHLEHTNTEFKRKEQKTPNLMENQMLLHATLLSTGGTADTLKPPNYANLNPAIMLI